MYTPKDCINSIKLTLSHFDAGSKDVDYTIEEIQMWLDKMENEGKPTKPTKIGFDNVEDAIDYYWEPSVNPNGSYEIDYELAQNEQSFCENEGFDWEDWKSTKQKKFTQNLDISN